MYGVGGGYLLDVKVDGVSYPVGEGRLAHLRIHEWSSVMAPMAEIALDDRDNFLVEMKGLTGTEVFDIGIGDKENNITYTPYRLFRTTSTRHGSDSHLIKLLLVSEKAAPMFSPSRYKSYPQSTVADVVRSVAADLALDVEVEPTEGTFDLFCPGWTYAQFMAWLSSRARSVAHGTSGFLYFVDIDNKLHFYSAEYAKVKSAQVNVIRKDLADPDSYDPKDVDLGPYRVYQNPMLLGNQAAWGLTTALFDFENSKFIEAPLTVDGSQGVSVELPASGFTSFERTAVRSTVVKGLADSLSILSSHTDSRNVIANGGVQNDVPDIALELITDEARLVRALNSMNKQDLLLEGDLRIRAGGLISEQIGSPLPQNVMNQTFSGKWVVEKVTHQLVPQYVTKVTVFRAGVSGSDKAGLLAPPGGVV